MANKASKLTEKPARMPEVRESQWDEAVAKYLHDVQTLNNETARSHRFTMLVQELLSVQPKFIEEFTSGIEKYLKVRQKDQILSGRADNLFGNVIIEFEASLPKKQSEAEGQLQKYVAILWSQESPEERTPYLCLATDGVRFITYTPLLDDPALKEVTPEDVQLQRLETTDWTKLRAYEVFYWLDRYFLRQERLHPTSEDIVADFGIQSHAFKTSAKTLLATWREIKAHSAFEVIYNSWQKYLRIVYGSEVAGEELFMRHTYLATLAKLMSWMRITGSESLPDGSDIIEMLEGQLFKRYGIDNYIEEDFFSWLAREGAISTGINVARWLFSLLQNYNLRELSEDVLKSLYQELVDPETRHDLGEFYTPDWLAHRMVKKLVEQNPQGTMLDPACGSGTFLYLAIREKREMLGDSLNTLRHILDGVYGTDVHPLAVIVAKTNYILALGDLLKKRKGAITIPIYLANTIRLPQKWGEMDETDYEIQLNGQTIYLPEALLRNIGQYDQAIGLASDYAKQNRDKKVDPDSFRNFLIAQNFRPPHLDKMMKPLFSIMLALKQFIESDRDTIWAYILKNFYKPLFFKQKFDFIMGNPPWIAFRYMEPDYQAFLKKQIIEKYKLLKGRGDLITHLEVGTFFWVRAADLYLKTGGTIAFVLPRSVFSADQHDGLRKREYSFGEDSFQTLLLQEVWDCEYVDPLFKVPCCVLIGDKVSVKGTKQNMEYPLSGQIISGKLSRKNASLKEAEEKLSVEETEISLHTRGKRSYWATEKDVAAKGPSYYKDHFFQGATIVPRSFWFVQVKPSQFGINPDLPLVETADRARQEAKDAYKSVYFKDTIESRFLYATLLSTDLLPFGHLDYRLVVLPIEPNGDRYRLIDSAAASERGFLNLARWLKNAEDEWSARRGEKAKGMSIYERINRVRGITQQNPKAMYRIIYNTSGTILTAAVVENKRIEIKVDGQIIKIQGYIVDTKTYFTELDDINEANFLGAVLNAPIVDKMIKPLQSRGLWGPRDIHKKVLELPIPQFDANNPTHQKLAALGKECTAKVQRWVESGGAGKIKSIGKLRGMVREMLKEELGEIDGIVRNLFK